MLKNILLNIVLVMALIGGLAYFIESIITAIPKWKRIIKKMRRR